MQQLQTRIVKSMQADMISIPAGAGTYCLILRMEKPAVLTIGKLGIFNFPAGWYVYTGSARGPGGLGGRLRHHLWPVANPHWHIDYLRSAATVQSIWYCVGETASEHAWAGELGRLPGVQIPAPRFGASDCRCMTHLVHFESQPHVSRAWKLTGSPIQVWRPEE